MSLRSMVIAACDAISLPAPNTVVGNSDTAVRVLLACAQREGLQLARRWSWQALLRTATFTSVAQQTQTGALPADFDGRIVSDTFWNTSRRQPVPGPVDPQTWRMRVSSVGASAYPCFRLMGGQILLAPVPVAGETYAFEYPSRSFCQSAGGVPQSAWAADTDSGLLDEELMTLGLIWRFKESRGMDYAEDMRTYEIEVSQATSRDGGRTVVDLSGDRDFSAPHYPLGVSIRVVA